MRAAQVDRLLEPATKLVPTHEVGAGLFGGSLALSANGETALIGAANDNHVVGAAWVFVRTASGGWREQAKLVGRGEVGANGSANGLRGAFGFSVALSADGDTALVGAPGDSRYRGAVWVFVRKGGVWAQQGQKLVASGEVGQAEFGISVALSANGDTALAGGPDDRWLPVTKGVSGYGAAWVFTRRGTTWSQQGPKIVGRGEPAYGEFGLTAALSGDGTTALVGSFNWGDARGAAWVFSRNGTTWSQQGPKITPRRMIGQAGFAYRASLSENGNIALISGPDDNHNIGAAWVFVRTRSGRWTQQGAKLTAHQEAGQGGFGIGAALSANASTMLIGGWADNGYRGAAWLFTRTRNGNWKQTKLTLHGVLDHPAFGSATALSADGTTALISGINAAHRRGAAWIFDLSQRTS